MIANKIAERFRAPLQVTDSADENVHQDQKRHSPVQDSADSNIIPRCLHAVLYRQYLKITNRLVVLIFIFVIFIKVKLRNRILIHHRTK